MVEDRREEASRMAESNEGNFMRRKALYNVIDRDIGGSTD